MFVIYVVVTCQYCRQIAVAKVYTLFVCFVISSLQRLYREHIMHVNDGNVVKLNIEYDEVI